MVWVACEENGVRNCDPAWLWNGTGDLEGWDFGAHVELGRPKRLTLVRSLIPWTKDEYDLDTHELTKGRKSCLAWISRHGCFFLDKQMCIPKLTAWVVKETTWKSIPRL